MSDGLFTGHVMRVGGTSMKTDGLEIYRRSYWDYYLALEERFAQTERFCAFAERNADAYSVEYLTLFLAACGEIDALGKEIVRRFYPDVDLGNCAINKWGYYVCEAFPGLGGESVEFADQFKFKPFDGWRQIMVEGKKGQPVYKRADDSNALTWWTDYNSVKHNRAVIDEAKGISNYEKANQGNLLRSIGALFLMNRLLMKYIDKDGYSSVERSRLFKLCGSIDEARSLLFYNSQGRPCVHIEKSPTPL